MYQGIKKMRIISVAFATSMSFIFSHPTFDRPTLEAFPLNEQISIDGRLDESFWNAIEPATGFIQRGPLSGEPATQKTEVRICYNENYIFVGATMYETDPNEIAAQLFRRDGSGYSDWFAVSIDSYFDRRTGFRFWVNPRGVKKDVLIYNDESFDSSWDAVWEGSAQINEKGWTVEIRIPFSQLRFNSDETEKIWGLQFNRYIARHDEDDFWAPILSDTQGFVSQFGTLTGIKTTTKSKRLEIMPYSSGKLFRTEGNTADPYYDENDLTGNLGVDFKYGLGSNFTLTGTVNPDFGQVEADPAVINLSAYETFFQERRPFFLEGMDIFSYGRTRTFTSNAPQIFYSRRIGRQPRGSIIDDNAIYGDYPEETTILAAAKLSGKTSNGWSIGILDAVTAEESAVYRDTSKSELSQSIEPQANTFISRIKKDYNEGRTIFGGFIGHRKQRLNSNYFQSILRDDAFVGGVDFEHRLGESDWVASGVITFSQINGSTEVITTAQKSSARYYQRPDQDYLTVDTTATSLSGNTLEFSITKNSGEHWMGAVTYGQTSPGFEINDIGFLNSADYRSLSTILIYQQPTPGKYIRNWHTYSGMQTNITFGNERGGTGLFFGANFQLNSFWDLNLGGNRSLGGKNFTLMRGGPTTYTPASYNFNINVSGDRRKIIQPAFGAGYRLDESGEYDKWLYTELQIRPNPTMEFEVEFSWGKQKDTDQYITSIEDEIAVDTYGKRYVFGDYLIDSQEIELGVDWTFSPNLSLQFFAKPFIMSYDFIAFKEFTTPGEFAFDYYGKDSGTLEFEDNYYSVDIDGDGPAKGTGFYNPDFNFRSLRLNAVLRWEFRPGSTLYFVWQQNRDDYVPFIGGLDPKRDVEGLFEKRPDNIFMIKASYWIGY